MFARAALVPGIFFQTLGLAASGYFHPKAARSGVDALPDNG